MNFLTSKKFVTTALVLLAVLNATLLGVLWWQNMEKNDSKHITITRQYSRQISFSGPVALSDSQSVSFRKLRREHFRKVRPEIAAIEEKKKQILEESFRDKPDSAKIATLAREIGAHQATMEQELAGHFHELSKICTPEQRDSLKSFLEHISRHNFPAKKDRWSFFPPFRETISVKDARDK
ncbi:MAG: periplasmic heavy metal sensor [Chlorobiaceae bacterium]|nr:periplasmic heavy metal sensor [Chlorobiaceae bacterium]NTV60158.1 periplasmic heavy metal sensor [Chlorobiaceae bacterium]